MWPYRRQPSRLHHPWDSPGKNTGVGCHFLLQCMKVKSENEVTQSCLTLSHHMDCSLPGSSIHGMFQARVLEWGTIAFSNRVPYHPAIPLLSRYPQKTITGKDTCTPTFIVVLFTTVRTWKPWMCPSIAEWKKKMWCIYRMECHAAIQKNEIMPFAATWKDLHLIKSVRWVRQRRTDMTWYHI